MSREFHEVEQNTRAWDELRIGIPTASQFGRIVTAERLDYSKGAENYAAELIAERMLGVKLDWGGNRRDGGREVFTEHGTIMEHEARHWYSMWRDEDVRLIGFVSIMDGEVGGSLDGLVDSNGCVEIKCRGAKAHMRSLLGLDPIASRLQTQGYLWLAGREWIDVVAYNDRLPKKIERQYRDEIVIDAIQAHVTRFLNERDEAAERLRKLDPSRVTHFRYRGNFGGSYKAYERDESSPTGVKLFDSFPATPEIEALIREKRTCALSPTERY